MSSVNSRVVVLGLAAVLSMASSAVFANQLAVGMMLEKGASFLNPATQQVQSGVVRLTNVDVINSITAREGVVVKSGVHITGSYTDITGGRIVNSVSVNRGFAYKSGVKIGD